MAHGQTMDFFTHQDTARKNTKRLVALFCVAVGGIVVALYLISRGIIFFSSCYGKPECLMRLWDPAAFIIITVCVILFVGLLSLIKIWRLRRGGGAVALMLGGVPVDRMTDDPKKRVLLNVVDEMAIASGVPVPDVYLMEKESGINAFAAGIGQDDAVVAVTKGCLDRLSRDELQGVIAHEFSHILNGDMSLNIHIMGVLYGIFALTIVGQYVLRGMRKSKGKGAAMIGLAGVGLLVVGYIGTFVGRMIQSAVCRQREFLADASAVQFTRNPSGLSGALKKIGGFAGSYIKDPQAEQASHFFFSRGVKIMFLSGLLASHPPLSVRIKRIDPSFEGSFPSLEGPAADIQASSELQDDINKLVSKLNSTKAMYAKPADVIETVGKPTPESLALSMSLINMMPQGLKAAASDRTRAPNLVYALLLDRDAGEREMQLKKLARLLRPDEMKDVEVLNAQMRDMNMRLYLPLFELAMASLRTLIADGLSRLSTRVNVLVSSDNRVTLFEFIVQWMIENRLMKSPHRAAQVVYNSAKPLLGDIEVLLAVLAQAGSEGDGALARSSFAHGREGMPGLVRAEPSVDIASEIPMGALKRALSRIGLASFKIKGEVVNACAHCAISDNRVSVREAELLRVVSLALQCPIPPFVGSEIL